MAYDEQAYRTKRNDLATILGDRGYSAPTQVSQKYLVDHLRNQVVESLAAFEGAKRDEEIERRMQELLSEFLVSWTREMAVTGVLAPPEEDVTVEFTSGTTLRGVVRIRNPERYPQFVSRILRWTGSQGG